MGRNHRWYPEHDQWIQRNPDGSYAEFRTAFADFPVSWEGFRWRRMHVLPHPRSAATREPRGPNALWRRPDTPPEMPPVAWDKREVDFHWSDVLKPLEELQGIAKAASGSQDRAHFRIDTDKPAPVLFISDWHVGSWGTSYQKVAEITQAIKDNQLWVAVLGDMLQMSIKLRNVLEISDNALPPRLQMRFMESWLAEMAPWVLWSAWDNHTVMREEAATGFSQYAELFRDKTVYHSGIGHVDLTVGNETYRIATSHRFRGNSYLNPTHGQMRYGRMEGLDREIIVAGDSHTPAVQNYADGPFARCAINCGTLQIDSGYAKRHFSLDTHDWMPVVRFHPDRHLFVSYPSLTHYLAEHGSASRT